MASWDSLTREADNQALKKNMIVACYCTSFSNNQTICWRDVLSSHSMFQFRTGIQDKMQKSIPLLINSPDGAAKLSSWEEMTLDCKAFSCFVGREFSLVWLCCSRSRSNSANDNTLHTQKISEEYRFCISLVSCEECLVPTLIWHWKYLERAHRFELLAHVREQNSWLANWTWKPDFNWLILKFMSKFVSIRRLAMIARNTICDLVSW